MSDPKRLFDDGADKLGKALLGAGRTLDAEQARARKLAMLGAAGAAAAATAVGTGAAAKSALHFVSVATLKWLGIGLVAAAVAAGGALLFARSGLNAEDSPEARAAAGQAPEGGDSSNAVITDKNTIKLQPSPEASASAGEIADAPIPAEGDPAISAPHTDTNTNTNTNNAAPSSKPHQVDPKAPPSSETGSSGESLVAEVTALKKAREALAAGRPKKALTELNIYDKRFRGGRLALEAEVLRIEALAQSGEGKAAAARAASFLSAHPSSPYANRVRAIAEGPKAAASE